MVARGRGGGKTPERLMLLLQEEVKKTSQAATARATGLTLDTVQRYIKGIGEPTTATLQKLSNYFEMPVERLRYDDDEYEKYVKKEMSEFFRKGNHDDNDELGWYCIQFGELLELTTEQEETLRSTGMIEDEYDAVSIGCFEKCLAEARRLLCLPEEEIKRYDSRLLQASKVLASLVLKRFAHEETEQGKNKP